MSYFSHLFFRVVLHAHTTSPDCFREFRVQHMGIKPRERRAVTSLSCEIIVLWIFFFCIERSVRFHVIWIAKTFIVLAGRCSALVLTSAERSVQEQHLLVFSMLRDLCRLGAFRFCLDFLQWIPYLVRSAVRPVRWDTFVWRRECKTGKCSFPWVYPYMNTNTVVGTVDRPMVVDMQSKWDSWQAWIWRQ